MHGRNRLDDDLCDRWARLWSELGAEPPAASLDEITAAWAEPHRAYHGPAHLAACLAELDLASTRALAERPAEVTLALWYHDAIYDPQSAGNEAQSARWAESVARAAGLPEDVIARVASAILATAHAAAPATPDEALLVDIDLAILGAPEDAFDAYERGVRKEYAHVPDAAFRAGRAHILQGFLAREALYATVAFRDRLEARAHANLRRSVSALLDGKQPLG